jgi:hypothetical protein
VKKKFLDGVWLPASLLSSDALPVATRAYLLMLSQGRHDDPGYWLRHKAAKQAVRIGLPADESGRRAWQRAKDALRSRGLLERRVVDAGGRILVSVEDPDPSPAALAALGRVLHEYRAIPPGGFAPGRVASENGRRTAFRSKAGVSEADRIAAGLDALSWTGNDDVERRYCLGYQRALLDAMDRLAIERMPEVVVHGLPWAAVPGLEGMANLADPDVVGFWGIQFPRAAATNALLRDVPEGTRNQILVVSALNKAVAKVKNGTWKKVAKPVAFFATLIAEAGTDPRDGLLTSDQVAGLLARTPAARPLSEWAGTEDPGDQRPGDRPNKFDSTNDNADSGEVGREIDPAG